MKNILQSLLLFLGLVLSAQTHEWKTDFEEVKKEAQSSNKKIIAIFSGSDWCLPCIKLKKEILTTPEFEKFAQEKFVIINFDYPNKKSNKAKQTANLVAQNKAMAEIYNKEGMFPRVMILDATGNKLGDVSYTNENVATYITSFVNY